MPTRFPRGALREARTSLPDESLEQLVTAVRPLLRRHRVPHVVLVDATDLEEAQRGALVAQAELLRDTPARGVAGDDRRLEPVEAEVLEAVPHDEHDALRHEALSRVVAIDPVPDERALERPALHTAEAHLADELAFAQEQPEAVRGVEVPLALPRAAAGPERLDVGDRVRAAGLGQRLPRLQPVAAARPDAVPRLPVRALERSQHHPAADEQWCFVQLHASPLQPVDPVSRAQSTGGARATSTADYRE